MTSFVYRGNRSGRECICHGDTEITFDTERCQPSIVREAGTRLGSDMKTSVRTLHSLTGGATKQIGGRLDKRTFGPHGQWRGGIAMIDTSDQCVVDAEQLRQGAC